MQGVYCQPGEEGRGEQNVRVWALEWFMGDFRWEEVIENNLLVLTTSQRGR